MLRELADAFIVFSLFSFLGWIFESVFCSISERRFINRGFLNGPACPIYGAGGLIAWYALAPIEGDLALFAAGAVGCSIVEYVTSWAMEKAYHARWWDYSDRFLNLNGRVCVPATLLFGTFSYLIARVMKPLVESVLRTWPDAASLCIAGTLAAIFAVDLAVTHIGLSGFRDKVDGYCDQLTHRASELYAAFSESDGVIARGVRMAQEGPVGRAYVRVREMMPGPVAIEDVGYDLAKSFQAALNRQEQRVLAAFPEARVKMPKLPKLPHLPKVPSVGEVLERARTMRDNLVGK